MKTTWEIIEKSTGKMSVTIAGERWQEVQEKAFNKLAKDTEVPGFRKGKAPKEMIKSRISSQNILMEALNDNISDFYVEAIEEHKIEPVAQPEVNIESLTLDEVVLTFTVVTKPEVILGDYENVVVDLEEVEVSEDELNDELAKLQEEFATMIVKDEDETVAIDDTVVIDYEGFDEDGVAFEGGKADNFDLVIGSNTFIPGFEDQLIGLKVNEEKDLNITFPEEYQAAELAGKPVVFKVKVHEIKSKQLPELNDDFAKDVDREGVETLDDLKTNIKDTLQHQKEHDAYHTAENQYMEEVIATAEVEIPEVMIEDEAKQLFEDFKQRIQSQGLTYDMYKQILGQTDEDVLEQVRPDAVTRLEMRLVLEAIANKENIEVSSDDIENEYTALTAQYGMELAQIKQLAPADSIAYDVKIKKVYDHLMEKHYAHVGSHAKFDGDHGDHTHE